MATETTEQTPRKPPKIANALVVFLLHSLLHKLVSNNLLLLTFKGRKTGKSYTIPLGYAQEGNTLTLFTDHGWWKNLQANPSVTVNLQGRERKGTAEVLQDDKEMTASELLKFVRYRPGAARASGVTFDSTGQPDPES